MGLSRTQFLSALEAMQKLPTNDDGKSAYAARMAWEAAATYGLTGADAVKFVEQMQRAVVNMSWEDVGRLDRALSDVAGLTRGAQLDGMSPDEIRKVLADRLEMVDFLLERVAPDLYAQWKLENKDGDDVNLPFFTTYDQR